MVGSAEKWYSQNSSVFLDGLRCSTDKTFRSMWSAFSWENKIIVNTNLQDLMELIKHIANITHMKIITDVANQTGSDFMAANLYVFTFCQINPFLPLGTISFW